MKKISSFLLLALLGFSGLLAQAPQFLNYQAVARDAAGNLLKSQMVSIRLSIHDGTDTGNIVYQETDTATTNVYGLFAVQIGAGSVVTGNFSAISWGGTSKYLQVELDPTGNTNYVNMGTSQLLSVPYALYAANGLSNGTQIGNTVYWNGSHWVTSSNNLFNDGLHIGIGTITPHSNLAAIGTVDFSRTGADGYNYELNISDTFPTVNNLTIPHMALFVGPPIGLHAVVALENTAFCCGGQDSLTAVLGVLDNSSPFHHIIRMTKNDFYMLASETNNVSGEYHISAAGISFAYQDTISSSKWLLSNQSGVPGQVLTLNSTADTAEWKSITNFSSILHFTPLTGNTIAVAAGSNIIEPASGIANLTIALPTSPANGDIVALSFTEPVGAISYSGGILANQITSALAGTTFKYIYYPGSGKWYNW